MRNNIYQELGTSNVVRAEQFISIKLNDKYNSYNIETSLGITSTGRSVTNYYLPTSDGYYLRLFESDWITTDSSGNYDVIPHEYFIDHYGLVTS